MTERELRLKAAAQAYYTDGTSLMSDAEYDSEMQILAREQPDSELFTEQGWGYSTRYDSTPGERVEHKYGKIGSLRKAYNWKETKLIGPSVAVDASAKLDGLTCVAYIYKGEIVRGVTNADENNMGIDITEKLCHILGFREIKDKSFIGGVRGEILMTPTNFSEFYNLHMYDKIPPKNPRNSTAGLINSKDITDDYRFIQFVPYTVVGIESPLSEPIGNDESIHDWVYKFLSDNFNTVVDHQLIVLDESNIDSRLLALRDNWAASFPVDGVVINPLHSTKYNILTNEVIYDAFAYKFPSEKKNSPVLKIDWNMSKSGYAIPLVWYQPVQLAGTTCEKATGYNAKYIKDNRICSGVVVEVEKRGEIIPNMNKVVSYPDAMPDNYIPTHCPVCGSALVWEQIKVEDRLVDGAHLKCPNGKCPNYREQDLSVWMEFLVPIDGLGDTLKFKFLSEWFGAELSIESVMDKNLSWVKPYSGSQGLKVENMLCMLWADSRFELATAIRALNIQRIGDKTADKFAEHPELVKACISYAEFDACSDRFEGNITETYSSLSMKLKDVLGEANTKSILDSLWKFTRLSYIKDRIIWEQSTQQVECKGKVAITGKLSVKRDVFEKELKAAGWIPGEMKKDTNFLITDDPTTSTTKNTKADELGIVKITEADFRVKYMPAVINSPRNTGSTVRKLF